MCIEEFVQVEKWVDFIWEDFEMILLEGERFVWEVIYLFNVDVENIGVFIDNGKVCFLLLFYKVFYVFV